MKVYTSLTVQLAFKAGSRCPSSLTIRSLRISTDPQHRKGLVSLLKKLLKARSLI